MVFFMRFFFLSFFHSLFFSFLTHPLRRFVYSSVRYLSSRSVSDERSFAYLLQMFFDRVLALMDYYYLKRFSFLLFCVFASYAQSKISKIMARINIVCARCLKKRTGATVTTTSSSAAAAKKISYSTATHFHLHLHHNIF